MPEKQLVKIKNKNYTVEKIHTLADLENKGLNNIVRECKRVGIVSEYTLSRNNGESFYTVYKYDDGSFSKVISVPYVVVNSPF